MKRGTMIPFLARRLEENARLKVLTMLMRSTRSARTMIERTIMED